MDAIVATMTSGKFGCDKDANYCKPFAAYILGAKLGRALRGQT